MARQRQFTSVMIAGLVLISLLLVLPAAAQDTGCSTPLDLSIGQRIFTRPGVFIRNLPSISGGQVEYYNVSRTLWIVGGPVCADGFNWWQIEGPDNPGWIAEGTPDFLLIFPDVPDVPVSTCEPPLTLAVGEQIILTTGARVRETPSLNGRVLTSLRTNTVLTVLGGSVCANNFNWWQVRAPFGNSGTTVDAWIAQGSFASTLVAADGTVSAAPAAVCAPPYRRLAVGVRAVVTYRDAQPKNLRAAPSRNAAIINTLLDGIAVDILDGPVCADGLNWWQVQVAGSPETGGWMAEGGTAAGGYWLIPLVFD